MRLVHGGCMTAAGSSTPTGSIAKRKWKKDAPIGKYQVAIFSPFYVFFCILTSYQCSQLQRDMQSLMHACNAWWIHPNLITKLLINMMKIMNKAHQDHSWHATWVEDNGTWKVFQVIQVDDCIPLGFFHLTWGVKVIFWAISCSAKSGNQTHSHRPFHASISIPWHNHTCSGDCYKRQVMLLLVRVLCKLSMCQRPCLNSSISLIFILSIPYMPATSHVLSCSPNFAGEPQSQNGLLSTRLHTTSHHFGFPDLSDNNGKPLYSRSLHWIGVTIKTVFWIVEEGQGLSLKEV